MNKRSLPKEIKNPENENLFYQVCDYLGRGSYALVVSARCQSNLDNDKHINKMVAIKMIMLQNHYKQIVIEDDDPIRRKKHFKILAQNEVDILFDLKPHRNILEIYEYFHDENHCYLVLEYCSNKTLNHLIKDKRTKMTKSLIKKLLFDIATGCQYIHYKLIVHRDIKLDNILLDSNLIAKIGDFGLAKRLESKDELLIKFCGTPKYQAPELLSQIGYSFPVDTWALGCIAYRLYYGNPPFDGINNEEIFKAVLNKNIKCCRLSRYNFNVTNQEIKLIRSLLNKDPEKRMKIEDLLKMEKFFDDELTSKSFLTSKRRTEEIEKTKDCQEKHMIRYLKDIKNFEQNKRIRTNYLQFHNPKLIPKYWIRQWIEITMYGFGYYLNSYMFGFNFKDQTKMMLFKEIIFYMDMEKTFKFKYGECPENLTKKLKILRQSLEIVRRTSENKMQIAEIANQSIKQDEFPWLMKWIKTMNAIVFQMDNRLIQINFEENRKTLLFDPSLNSMSLVNLAKMKTLSLCINFILNGGNISEKMQQYVSVALQYIDLLNNS